MDSWLAFFLGAMSGTTVSIAVLTILTRPNKDIVEVDPEKEEAEKQWNDQSKGYK